MKFSPRQGQSTKNKQGEYIVEKIDMGSLWTKLKLRNKFLIPTVLLILLGMGVSSTISYVSSKNTLSETAVKDLKKSTTMASHMLDQCLKDRTLDVQYWANQKIAALSGGADTTPQRAQLVASASEEMSANMGTVAGTMDEASTNVNMVA